MAAEKYIAVMFLLMLFFMVSQLDVLRLMRVKTIVDVPESVYFPNLSNHSPSIEIPLVVVLCSSNSHQENADQKLYFSPSRQVEQLRVMIGSLLYFSLSPKWRIIVFTNSGSLYQKFLELLDKWPSEYRSRLLLEKRPTKLTKYGEILKYYRPCAWFKTFLDETLSDLDAAVYIDTDVVFTGPAEDLWQTFSKFNKTQMIALAPEPLYARDKGRIYGGAYGVNTGVMVLNLTRMRSVPNGGFSVAMMGQSKNIDVPAYHDQDLANFYLHQNPHFLLEISVKWNFMLSYCSSILPPCEECYKTGVTIVHGAEGTFYRNVDGKIRVLYKSLEEATNDMRMPPQELLKRIQMQSEIVDYLLPNYLCGEIKDIPLLYTLHLRSIVQQQCSLHKTSCS